jgi:hypothetical protein
MAQGLSLKEVGQVSHLIPMIGQESKIISMLYFYSCRSLWFFYALFSILGSISKSEFFHKCSLTILERTGTYDIKTKLLWISCCPPWEVCKVWEYIPTRVQLMEMIFPILSYAFFWGLLFWRLNCCAYCRWYWWCKTIVLPFGRHLLWTRCFEWSKKSSHFMLDLVLSYKVRTSVPYRCSLPYSIHCVREDSRIDSWGQGCGPASL